MDENGEHTIRSNSSTTSTSMTIPTTTITSPPSTQQQQQQQQLQEPTPASSSPPPARSNDMKPPRGQLPVFPALCNGYTADALLHRRTNGAGEVKEEEEKEKAEEEGSNRLVQPMVRAMDSVKEDSGLDVKNGAQAKETSYPLPGPCGAVVKQEHVAADQDGPLDFSLRRRATDSLKDDRKASPPGHCGLDGVPKGLPPSLVRRHSPEHAHPFSHPHSHPYPQLQSFHLAPTHHRHHPHQPEGGSSNSNSSNSSSSYSEESERAERGHSLPHADKSPGASPDYNELIGQPKTARSSSSASSTTLGAGGGVAGGFVGSRPPVNPSLAALGLLAEGGGGMGPSTMSALLSQQQNGSQHPLAAFMTDMQKGQSGGGGKMQRPFKAYPKEVLQMPLGCLGLPNLNPFLSGEAGTRTPAVMGQLPVNHDDMLSMYKQQLELLSEGDKHGGGKGSSRPPPGRSAPSAATTPPAAPSLGATSRSNGMAHPASYPSLPSPSRHQSTSPAAAMSSSSSSSFFPHGSLSSSTAANTSPARPSPAPPLPHSSKPYPCSGSSSFSSSSSLPTPAISMVSSSTATVSGNTSPGSGSGAGSCSRKRPQSLPENQKDEAYWERRRKNNDAAKRSRDARRVKEDEIAIRAALLEQENIKLRVEVAALKTETARLRCMLYNNS